MNAMHFIFSVFKRVFEKLYLGTDIFITRRKFAGYLIKYFYEKKYKSDNKNQLLDISF